VQQPADAAPAAKSEVPAPIAKSEAPAPVAKLQVSAPADAPKSPDKSASSVAAPPKNAPDARPAAAPKQSAPVARTAPAAASPVPVAVAPAAGPPPLDLKSLEQKLKDTTAIGLMTKLAIKNQVDDLVSQFRAYHQGRQPPTLAELRRPYELLLMKLLALLQDQDPGLAKTLHDSRDAIWGVLSDRNKFEQNA
jgi:hypothetical protein